MAPGSGTLQNVSSGCSRFRRCLCERGCYSLGLGINWSARSHFVAVPRRGRFQSLRRPPPLSRLVAPLRHGPLLPLGGVGLSRLLSARPDVATDAVLPCSGAARLLPCGRRRQRLPRATAAELLNTGVPTMLLTSSSPAARLDAAHFQRPLALASLTPRLLWQILGCR